MEGCAEKSAESLASDSIQKHEGFSTKPYTDPSGVGVCIWYGFNLDLLPEETQRLMAKAALDVLISVIIRDLERALERFQIKFSQLPLTVKAALIELCYNMGLKKLLTFNRMLVCISNGDWAGAKKELLDSAYARQVPKRAKNVADMIWSS